MNTWAQDRARRLIFAAGVAFVVGAPTLACMGVGETTGDEVVTDDGDGDGDDSEITSRLVGDWHMVPQDLRRYRIIQAALSGKPAAKKKLNLKKEEEALFDEWAAATGQKAEDMRAEIKYKKETLFTFTDSQATVTLAGDKFGPVDFTVVSADGDNIVLTFDPGLGNGMETHSISLSDDNNGVNVITSTERGAFAPVNIKRKKK
ncbi:MAG TPA: hypothetical protein ENK18_23720 [Deltaproteobacteria bacterium]|nr:hypothetical protein [Deltaproteobacteria bacterium]